MARPLVVIGAGEFAQIACEYFEHDSDYDVVAFSVEREYLTQPILADRPVVAYEALEAHYPPSDVDLYRGHSRKPAQSPAQAPLSRRET